MKNTRIMNRLRKFVRRYIVFRFMVSALERKWTDDSRYFPLENGHRKVWKEVHRLYWVEFNRFPNLIDGESYNEKIQWLKIFNQDWSLVGCTDKIELKNYVEGILGEGYVPKTYQICKKWEDLDIDKLPNTFVLKTNHDSGTVILVKSKKDFDVKAANSRLKASLRKKYGRVTAEWSYEFISRKIFAEELLPFIGDSPPPDYKFHCSNGVILWLQYIYDRGNNTKEVIADQYGCVLGIKFDQNMQSMDHFDIPENWDMLKSVACRLSTEFKYVRVDLYSIGEKIYVGELTFFPLAGVYKSEGNILLGNYLRLDRSKVLPPII